MNYKTLACAVFAFLPLIAHAQWTLDTQASEVQFSSIKKNTVAEVHTVNFASGTVDNKGQISLALALNTVESAIPIRNQRMKEHLFEVATYPLATITSKITLADYSSQAVGSMREDTVSFKVDMHGKQKTYSLPVTVVKLQGERLLVSSAKPLTLNAADFALSEGIETLRNLAKLPVIASSVPVTFNLVFKTQ